MKRMLVFSMVFVFAVVFSSTVFADENRLGIGARVGYLNYADDSYDEYGATIDFDDGVIFGANATYIINDYFSLELSLSHCKDTDAELGYYGVSTDIGELSMTPLLLTAQYRIPTYFAMNFSPYLGAGLGYYFNDFDPNALAKEFADVDIDDSLGWHVNLGADLFLDRAKHVALNFDFKYFWTEADLNVDYDFTYGGTPYKFSEKDDIDLDGFIAAIGVSYFF